MNQLSMYYRKINLLFLSSIFAVVIFTGSALAGDDTLQKNLINLSELTSKWSKQLNSGKVTPEMQEKLSEMLNLMSQILRNMSEKTGEQMQKDNSVKIEQMQKEWDPFDTSDKM